MDWCDESEMTPKIKTAGNQLIGGKVRSGEQINCANPASLATANLPNI